MEFTREDNILYGQKYNDWASINNHVMQISMMRSGRNWLARIVCGVLDAVEIMFGRRNDINLPRFDDKLYLSSHYYKWVNYRDDVKYVLLIRDPRDMILSMRIGENRKRNLDVFSIKKGWIKRMCNSWVIHYLNFMKKNTIIVQYERLCLYPIREIERIINFTGYEPVNDIRQIIIKNDRGNDSISDQQRYDNHCLKWQKHERFREEIVPNIWNELKDIMPYYGYLEGGHSTNLLVQ